MAMSMSGASDAPMMEINTTPLIDVMLVLLIMLIITLPAMTHSIGLEMPNAGEGAVLEPIDVLVDFDGTVLWNGVVTDMAELERRIRLETQRQPQPTLSVRADRRAKYDTFAHVLAIAQRNGVRYIAVEGAP